MELLQWLQVNGGVDPCREKLTTAVMKQALQAMKATRCYPRALICGNQEILKDTLLKIKTSMARATAVNSHNNFHNEGESDSFVGYDSRSDPDSSEPEQED